MAAQRVREHLERLVDVLSEALRMDLRHCFLSPDFLFVDGEGKARMAGLGLFDSIDYPAFEQFISGVLVPISQDSEHRFLAVEILSPEIRTSGVPVRQSDQYCLGMCAYYLLTGTKAKRRPEPVQKRRPEVAEGWDWFIRRCLEGNPDDRYANYRSFLDDLERVESLTPEKAGKRGKSRGGSRGAGKRRKADGGAAQEPGKAVRPLLMAAAGLAGLGLVGVILWGLVGILLGGSGDEEAETGPSVVRVEEAEAANVRVTVPHAGARLLVERPVAEEFVLASGGEFLLRVANSRRLRGRVEAPLRVGGELDLKVGGEGLAEKRYALPYRFGRLEVLAEPGTEILSGQTGEGLLWLGEVGETGRLVLEERLLTGELPLVARKAGFEEARAVVPVTAAGSVWEVEQAGLPARLEIRAEKELAEDGGLAVYLEGRKLGETPLMLSDVKTGKPLTLRFRRPGFRAGEATVELEAGEQRVLVVDPLEPERGSLRVEVDWGEWPSAQEAEDWVLQIDGEAVEDLGEAEEVAVGERTVRFRHAWFEEYEETVEVADGALREVLIEVEPRPVELIPLVKAVGPVQYRLNGEAVEPGESGAFLVEAGESMELRVAVRDHFVVRQRFRGHPGERIEWEVPLRRIPGPERGEGWNPPYVALPMVWVEAGRFRMGSALRENRRLPNEGSATYVRLDYGYWIGREEVSQGLYEQVMGDNPSVFRGERHPVDSVSFEEAATFCRRLTMREEAGGRLPAGYVYRLPTEAEWEYAARAGTEGPFWWGERANPERGNFQGTYSAEATSGQSEGDRYGTVPVGQFGVNPWGLVDVHGNVAEWTLDRYWDRLPGGQVVDPVNLERGRGRVIRGGSWQSSADRVRAAAREGVPEGSQRGNLGFRVVLAPEVDGLRPW